MILSKDISVFGTVGDTCSSMHCSSVIGARGYSNAWKDAIKQIVGWPNDMTEGRIQEFMYNIFNAMDSEILMDPISLFNELRKYIHIDAVTMNVIGQGSINQTFTYCMWVKKPDAKSISWVAKIEISKHNSLQAPYSHILDNWVAKCNINNAKIFPSGLVRNYAYIDETIKQKLKI